MWSRKWQRCRAQHSSLPGALSLLDEVRAPGRVQVVRATPSEPICSAAALAASSNFRQIIKHKIWRRYNQPSFTVLLLQIILFQTIPTYDRQTCMNFFKWCAPGRLGRQYVEYSHTCKNLTYAHIHIHICSDIHPLTYNHIPIKGFVGAIYNRRYSVNLF